MFKRLLTLLALLAIVSAGALEAQGVTAFKTGEKSTGMTKQCSYSFGGTEYTKTIASYELCPLSITIPTPGASGAVPGIPSIPSIPSGGEVTAFKTGENSTGMTKQCFYSFAGNEYTKTVESYALCPLSIKVSSSGTSRSDSPTSRAQSSEATAFKTGENTTGMTKQCFYDFAGKQYTKTIESYQLCPLSVKVPQS